MLLNLLRKVSDCSLACCASKRAFNPGLPLRSRGWGVNFWREVVRWSCKKARMSRVRMAQRRVLKRVVRVM